MINSGVYILSSIVCIVHLQKIHGESYIEMLWEAFRNNACRHQLKIIQNLEISVIVAMLMIKNSCKIMQYNAAN